MCVNKITVKGAVQEVQDEVYFSGSGAASQVFTLAYKPISVQVWEDVAGTWTLKTPGVEDSTSGTYDYEVDKENKKIICTASWTPASGTNNVKVVPVRAIPVPVLREDPISQANYGVHAAEKYFNDIQTVNDARRKGDGYLSKYANPFVSTMLKSATNIDYEVGRLVSVVDNLNDENRSVVINEIIKRWPHRGDELKVGDKEWRLEDWGVNTMERIRRIEEQFQQDTDFIVHVSTLSHTITPSKRYLRITKRSVEADGFILGHPDYGILGTSKFGSPFGSESVERVIWPSQTYKEQFFDDEFKETGGTANWDNANRELVF